jgi:hypothetical protein
VLRIDAGEILKKLEIESELELELELSDGTTLF